MHSLNRRPSSLYSVSWEVCNPTGGVHTVISSSAAAAQRAYGDELLYVGPDLWAARTETSGFIEDSSQRPLAALAQEREIPVRFGRWDVPGKPAVALINFSQLLERKNEILGDLWNDFGVDSIHADWDTVERVLFGYAAGAFVELHYHATVRPRARAAVAHFHQWQSACGILRLSSTAPEIATVYTPHGTAAGRAFASAGVDASIADAKDHGAATQASLEQAAAEHASIMTAVSEHAADEAFAVLGRRAEVITPNGYAHAEHDAGKRRAEVRAAILQTGQRFLGTALRPDTQIALCSGRYEFRNKGLDVAIDAIGELNRRSDAPARKLLFLMFVPATQTGQRREVVRRLRSSDLAGAPAGVCTHNVAHVEDDAILNACDAAGLNNAASDHAYLMFVPVFLDGSDGVFPFPYMDVLHACDISVFPSMYEPWGYTPVESLGAGVPTITTNATGFGRFVAGLDDAPQHAVTILDADTDPAGQLAEALASFLNQTDEDAAGVRNEASRIVADMSWENIFPATQRAYDEALLRAGPRRGRGRSTGFSGLSRRSLVAIPSQSADKPSLHRFSVSATLPAPLTRLLELARNVWWSWSPDACALFARIGGTSFHAPRSNAVAMLRNLGARRMAELAQDAPLIEHIQNVLAKFDAYRARERLEIGATAYFCAEFALHESLPIYSGGLGVLAGDHLKAASDLSLPLTAIGLRYAKGYFVQRIQADGSQGAEYITFDPRESPLVEVMDDKGAPLRIRIPMPEGELAAGVWRVDVGSVPLYLLDARVSENHADQQGLTERLYPSDRESRIRQEILLGIGGWRVLRALGREPRVCHLNEGHSAFLQLERLLRLIEDEGLTYAEASIAVRSSTLFTTHTPVPAGHDRFAESLMRRYFGHVADRLGLSWDEFFDLGRTSPDEHEFSMTVLALRFSEKINGVSKLHGQVSRDMLAGTWPQLHPAETPISSITNGVHLPTWVGPEMGSVLEHALAPTWRENVPDVEGWARAQVPDQPLWDAHRAQKRRMIDFVLQRAEETGARRGVSPSVLRQHHAGADENALWVGYARRFAPYKRATLLFDDAERLQGLLNSTDRPVRVVFSGKAHPDDREGGELVKKIVALTEDPRFVGRVYFVENYDMTGGRLLTQGVDVWLNTPTRPLEASGTSGMKSCLNGGLHLSILDGWWCEGYNGENGWSFGDGFEHSNPVMQREYDARALYGLLENEVVPLFFNQDENGRPAGWIERMRRTIQSVPGLFSTRRMLNDYVSFGYRPLGEKASVQSGEEYRAVRALAKRHIALHENWDSVRIEDLSVTDQSEGTIGLGDLFAARARVRHGDLAPDGLNVELFVGAVDDDGQLQNPTIIPLLLGSDVHDGLAVYTGAYQPTGAGEFAYGVRVMPRDLASVEAARLGLIRWA